VATVSALPSTGNSQNDAFIVDADGDLYVWGSGNNWSNVGQIVGPQGDTGATGATGATGPRPFTILGTYNNGMDYGYDDAVYYQGGTYIRTGNPNNPGYPPTPGAVNASWTPLADKGDTGDAGAVGPQGLKGDTGDTGPQGLTGDTGNTGAVGAAGLQGLKGDTGPQGLNGDTGNTGATGAQGLKGDKGDTGNTGAVGAAGPQGLKGDTGNTGAVGATGLQGLKGDTGNTGNTGPQGLKGDTGNTGAVGATGPQGLQGDTGNTGAVGPQGVKGDKGDTGDTGLQGTQGIVTSPTPPTNTTVIWQDTSVPNQSFVPAERTINTTAPLLGGGSLNGNLTLSIDTTSLGAAVRPYGISNIVDTLSTIPTNSASWFISAGTGSVNYMTFAVGAPMTVSNISVPTYYQGFAGWNNNPLPSYVAFGLYQINDFFIDGQWSAATSTLLAKTDNNPGLCYMAGTTNKAAFSGAGGYPTSYTLQPNVRYAVGIMAIADPELGYGYAYIMGGYNDNQNGMLALTPSIGYRSSSTYSELPISESLVTTFGNYSTIPFFFARLSS
jgi:hypothetical protein